MYSVVLATMMTVSAGSTGWWNCHGCHGCHGCSGFAFSISSCHGCYGGCYGCSGCFGCGGCYGGCYGGSGCYGGAYGVPVAGLLNAGCFGCYGSSYGYWGGYVPVVAYAPPFAAPTYAYGYAGSYAVVASGQKSQPTATTPQGEIAQLRAEVASLRQQLEPNKQPATMQVVSNASKQPAPAQVTVHLPADAKLYIDDVVCSLTSDTRSFATPKLQPGRKYYYMVRAETIRDGAPITETQRVILEPGQHVAVTFTNLSVATRPQP
jgi:uncharacterized protein (TIGR03000 family)